MSLLTKSQLPSLAKLSYGTKREKPTYCPDGLQESDKFFEYYFAPGGAMRLQFRDERLVNHIVSPQTAAFFRNQISQ